MFDNIKEQSHEAISKVLDSIAKYEEEQALSNS